MNYKGSFSQTIRVSKFDCILNVDEYSTCYDVVLTKVGFALPCFVSRISKKGLGAMSLRNYLINNVVL